MKLEARDVAKSFGSHAALAGVTFSSGDASRVIALLGPSGGGKSTLLRVLGCLLVPETGEVSIDDETLPRDEAGALAERRKNGFVFQGYNLFPHLTALENVALPLRAVHGMDANAARGRARELLDRLGLQGRAARSSQFQAGEIGRRAHRLVRHDR